ncbi:hypothetical protein D3C71_1214060 [compost metagenome]
MLSLTSLRPPFPLVSYAEFTTLASVTVFVTVVVHPPNFNIRFVASSTAIVRATFALDLYAFANAGTVRVVPLIDVIVTRSRFVSSYIVTSIPADRPVADVTAMDVAPADNAAVVLVFVKSNVMPKLSAKLLPKVTPLLTRLAAASCKLRFATSRSSGLIEVVCLLSEYAFALASAAFAFVVASEAAAD